MDWDKSNYRRGFWALIATQFQSAFNDNALRWIIVYHLLERFRGTPWQDWIVAITGVIFTVPFILFPGYAGALADRYSKKTVAVWTKCAEVVIVVLAAAALWINNPILVGVVLFLMLTQSTFFSPAKYGILPEILPETRLSWGNGILQMMTFIPIILGTGAAGWLSTHYKDRIYAAMWPLLIVAVLGVLTSLIITKPPAADPRKRLPLGPWEGLGHHLKLYLNDRVLFWVMLGASYFWFVGAFLQQNITNFGKFTLSLGDDQTSYLVVSIALGMGLGGAAAGYLSRGRIETGLVPLGAFGLALLTALLGVLDAGYGVSMALLFGLGFFSGFYEVPLNATIQQRSPNEAKGGMLATYNFVNSLGILLASLLLLLVYSLLHFSTHALFILGALMTLAVAVCICTLLPMTLLRFILCCAANTLYRVITLGRENIPEKGGALFLVTQFSLTDALIITFSLDRRVRFVMARETLSDAWARRLAKVMNIIAVTSESGPEDLDHVVQTAVDAVAAGELVCIFTERQTLPTGEFLPFRDGLDRIMKAVNAPIIPVCAERIWGTCLGFYQGRFTWKLPIDIPHRIMVNFGRPISPDSTPQQVRRSLQELGSETYAQRKFSRPLLHRAFIKTARRYPFQTAVGDMLIPKLSYIKTLAGSIAFARKLRHLLDGQPMTGLLLPPTVGGALANIALQLMGKIPINLNYTASAEALASAARQCQLTQILTAKAFLEKVPLVLPCPVILLEEVRKTISGKDRLVGLFLALFAPTRLIERIVGSPRGRSIDDLATIIFSSGSEGEPKGAMLTQFNVLSNVECAAQTFPHNRKDLFMGVLPFFHSFGFTDTLWLAVLHAFGAIFYPSPLEAKIIGELVYKNKARFLIVTPTFLQNFIRRCAPEELRSLMYVITGAEKLTARIREAFNVKFGIEPLEGYGTTECAPGVAVNIPDFVSFGACYIGNKAGTIGRPLPGFSLRIIDPDSGEELADGEPGLLYVKGPSVMKGYLGMPEKTAAVLQNGWYNTGDIAAIDEDGFITITDRLSRFSKIAGEMVPHNKIEEELHRLLELTEQSLAVTGVPDPQRGERLIVLHTLDEQQFQVLLEKLTKSTLPPLWLPKASAFYRIGQIPVLGTGKVDLKKIKALARQLDVGE